MVFEIEHTFKNVSGTKTHTYSPFFPHGSSRWQLCLRTQKTDLKENFQIILFASPLHKVPNKTLFEIKANYKAVISSHVFGKSDYSKEEKEAAFYKEKGGEAMFCGSWLFIYPFEEIKKNGYHLLKNDEMTVTVEIDIISGKRIDSFPLYAFDKEFKDSDVIASIEGVDFHLHSQILSFHSAYFEELLQNKLKNEEPQVGLKVEKKKFLLRMEEDFDLNLIRTSFSILYSFGYKLLNELNVKDILKLNSIWRSDTISAQVEMYMASNLNLLNIPIEEVIVLAWKYNLHSLKLIVLEEMTSIDIFKKISNLEDYKTLKEGTKSDLTEQILFKAIAGK